MSFLKYALRYFTARVENRKAFRVYYRNGKNARSPLMQYKRAKYISRHFRGELKYDYPH